MGVKRAIQKDPHSSLLQNAAAQHSVSGLHALLEGHAASPAGYKQSLRKLEDVMKIHTPYGCLVKYIEVPLTNGKAYTWAVCNPFALLYHLCEISSGWNRFLHKWLGGGAGLLLYTDECTPGNALHFQNLRDFTAIYFTMSKLPSWFRARARGWFKLGFIKTDMVKDVKGELAGVCRVVLHLLYNKGGFNFSIGMLLPAVRKTEARWRLQLTFLCFLQDAKAHKEVANVKGAAGLKSCLNCKNVGKFLDANKEPLQGHPYLHHYALALPDQFDQHTVESFWEIADKLAEQHGVVSKTEFKELEKMCGVGYEPDGLLYDMHVRSIYCPVSHTYWDPMHILVASGGVCQYECNAFIYHAKHDLGVQPEQIDAWASNIRWPAGAIPPAFALPLCWSAMAHATPATYFIYIYIYTWQELRW